MKLSLYIDDKHVIIPDVYQVVLQTNNDMISNTYDNLICNSIEQTIDNCKSYYTYNDTWKAKIRLCVCVTI